MHPHFSMRQIEKRSISLINEQNENNKNFWIEKSQEELKTRISRKLNKSKYFLLICSLKLCEFFS